MAEHAEHVTIDAWAEDCIEGECEHIDEDGMPDDLSACVSFQVEVCVDCQVERGMTSDPAWWDGALSPWPCLGRRARMVRRPTHQPHERGAR